MIELQVLTRILDNKDLSVIKDSVVDITPDYFGEYEEQYQYIYDYYTKYKIVPDKLTFLSKYPDIPVNELVTETDKSLRDNLINTYKFNKMLKVFNSVSTKLEPDTVDEVKDFIVEEFAKIDAQTYIPKDEGVIGSVSERIHNYEFINQNQAVNFIPTGFYEIDNDIVGLQRGDELVVFYARTNMGKSWIVEAIGTNIVEQGYRVGYFSPEMSKRDIGYRFDTLHGNISNSAMKFGKITDDFNIDVYKKYGDDLKELKGEMFVTTPVDFARKLTVTKLRDWKEHRKLDVIIIDGITYLTDERFKKGDSKTISLTNISEDLMTLSGEVGIPILVVVQANRGGVIDKTSLDTPELENIRDSDGIAMNASKVYAVKQMRKDEVVTLVIENKKNRSGKMGQTYTYTWDIDMGKFEPVDASSLDTNSNEYDSPRKEKKPITAGTKRRRVDTEDDY